MRCSSERERASVERRVIALFPPRRTGAAVQTASTGSSWFGASPRLHASLRRPMADDRMEQLMVAGQDQSHRGTVSFEQLGAAFDIAEEERDRARWEVSHRAHVARRTQGATVISRVGR